MIDGYCYKGYVITKRYENLTDKEIEALEIGIWIVENKATMKQAAKKFGFSYSTIHRRIYNILHFLSWSLYTLVSDQSYQNRADNCRRVAQSRRKY